MLRQMLHHNVMSLFSVTSSPVRAASSKILPLMPFSINKSATAIYERTDLSVWYDLDNVDELSVEAREYLTLRGKLEFGKSPRFAPFSGIGATNGIATGFVCGAAASYPRPGCGGRPGARQPAA